uniref:Transporter n=1 Tax=Sinonovacula rivularis TaxID=489091 RepID=A0AA50AI52_9BIVA|nr:AAT3 [Sinonovacula rivularis]
MPGLRGGGYGYSGDTGSVDSNGSVSLSHVSGNPDPTFYGGAFDNEAYVTSASQATLNTIATTDSRAQLYGVDENEERGNWTGRFDFLLSLLGYAVGLGNVWRFPYLCYRNGGGAFLIPFAIMMIIVGMPLFFMEASLGQFTSCGPMTCWEFAPLLKGVGVSMVVVSAMTSMYYNMVLAWAFYYMFASFTSELPWTDCNNKWNTKYCAQKVPLRACDGKEEVRNEDGSCYNADENLIGVWNDTLFTETTGIKRPSAAEEYWNNEALHLSDGIDNFGQPGAYMVLCLMLAWIVVFFCLIKGIKSTGKVVYFTAIFPYVVLVILFFRGVTLENSGEGIKFFIVPKFEKLLDARVWKDAAVQVFFSMSIAGGGLVTLSSYNRFHNNILKDSIIVVLGDFFTCIFAGFVIFSYLGFMAGRQGTTVDKVAQDGAGLAFVVYPEAVTSLPAPPFWSFLFFFMLITLGLDSQFAMVETVLTGCMDQFPYLRPKKTFVILIICICFFLIGLPLTCPGGMYFLQLMDNFVGGWTLLIIGFAENIAIAYCYGNKHVIAIRWFL